MMPKVRKSARSKRGKFEKSTVYGQNKKSLLYTKNLVSGSDIEDHHQHVPNIRGKATPTTGLDSDDGQLVIEDIPHEENNFQKVSRNKNANVATSSKVDRTHSKYGRVRKKPVRNLDYDLGISRDVVGSSPRSSAGKRQSSPEKDSRVQANHPTGLSKNIRLQDISSDSDTPLSDIIKLRRDNGTCKDARDNGTCIDARDNGTCKDARDNDVSKLGDIDDELTETEELGDTQTWSETKPDKSATKRKRGRPMKTDRGSSNKELKTGKTCNLVRNNKTSVENSEIVDAPITDSMLTREKLGAKPKRGKPRKAEVIPIESTVDDSDLTEDECKVRRGRPRKTYQSKPMEPKLPKKRKRHSSDLYSGTTDTDAAQEVTINKKTKTKAKQSTEVVTLTCLRCGVRVDSTQKMKYHMMSAHTAVYSENNPHGDESTASLRFIRKRFNKLFCAKCRKSFTVIQYYQHHVTWCGREHETFVCHICCKEVKMMWHYHHLNYHNSVAKKAFLPQEIKKEENATGKRKSAKKAEEIMKNYLTQDVTDVTKNTEGEKDGDYDVQDDKDHENISTPKKDPKIYQTAIRGNVVKKIESHLEIVENSAHVVREFLFTEMLPKTRSWEELPQSAHNDYLPVTRQSCTFQHGHLKHLPIHSPPVDQSLKLFESTQVVDNCGERLTIFVGGPIWAMAWCPTPMMTVTDQYLAVACHRSMDEVHPTSSAFSGRGLIQIWHFSDLGCASRQQTNLVAPTASEPCLMACISHNNGCVYDMAWCPQGVYQPASATTEDGYMPRLGLLAVGYSNGTTEIFSVPHADSLTRRDNRPPLYKVQPSLRLLPPGSPDSRSCCMSLSWQYSQQCHRLAAAYGNGHVHLWDITTQSPLLRTPGPVSSLHPYNSFIAHLSGRCRISWFTSTPGYLITASHDQSLKIWEVTDTSRPVYAVRRARISALDAMYDANKIFFAFDSVAPEMQHNFHICFAPIDSRCSLSVLPGTFGCTWDMSYSPWLQTLVSVDELGALQGVVVSRHKVVNKSLRFLLYLAKKVAIKSDGDIKEENDRNQDDRTVAKDAGTECDGGADKGDKSHSDSTDATDNEGARYADCVRKWSLHLLDSMRTIKSQYVADRKSVDLHSFPLNSINRVQFNPNMCSSAWLASGTNCGLLRLHNMSHVLSEFDRAVLRNLTPDR